MPTTLTFMVRFDTTTGEATVEEDHGATAAADEESTDHGVTEEHGADAEHGTEEAPNPILPTGPEIFWGATLFTLLWVLMKFVLLPPITKVMEQREQKVGADRAATEQATADVVNVRRDYETKVSAARQEGARLVEDARHRAEAKRAELVSAADAEISTLREEAAAEVASAKQAALAGVQSSVADLAIEAAEAVIQKELDREAHRAFVNDYLSGKGSAR